MKNKLSVLIILCSLFFSIESFGQNVDSVAIKISRYNYENSIWEYRNQTIDSFSNGVKSSELTRTWSNNSWVNSNLDIFSYTGAFLNQKISQNWDSTQWLNDKRIIYMISPSLDSTIEQHWNGAWVNYNLTITYRDIRNLDSLILNKRWISLNWIDFKKAEYTFSPDSSVLTQLNSVWDTIQLQWYYSTRYDWLNDSLERDTGVIIQTYNSAMWQNYEGTFYTYDSLGNINFEFIARWNSFDWSNWREYHNYTYDSLNRISFEHIGFIPGLADITYSYDSLGNLIDIFVHSETMSGRVNEYNTHWYYFTFPDSSELFLFVNDHYYTCSLDSIPIGAFAFGGSNPLSFNWSPSSGLSSDTVENPYLFAASTTTYSITVTDINANSKSAGLTINVFKSTEILNIQSNNTSCIGCNDGKFIINTNDTSFYYITLHPNPGATILNDTIFNLPPGIYTICVRNLNDCVNCVVDTIFDDITFVKEYSNEKINLYPNPFTSSTELYINYLGENMVLKVMDSFGRLIKTIKIDSAVTTISGNDLSPGTYFGILQSGNSIVARLKLVYIK